MYRRKFLATAAGALSIPLIGCLAGSPDDTDTTPRRPWASNKLVENPDGTHHLFIENHTKTTEAAWVRVTNEDGEALVNGRYELPHMRGITFEEVASWKRTHTIDVAIDGEERVSLEWITAECGPESEASVGSRNASVRVMEPSTTDDRIELLIDQCDALYGPSVPVGPAEGFRLDQRHSTRSMATEKQPK